ncbi:MAG: low molecular weight protein tyrosine phosphatase family protein [Kiloniellaceae bacterium]
MTRLLFVCSRNRLRSPTAEAVFTRYEGIEAISAGTAKDAETPLTADLIDWADIVFVMEKAQRAWVTQRFRAWLRDKRLVVLGIPDNYAFMDPDLVRLLERKVASHLRKKAD